MHRNAQLGFPKISASTRSSSRPLGCDWLMQESLELGSPAMGGISWATLTTEMLRNAQIGSGPSGRPLDCDWLMQECSPPISPSWAFSPFLLASLLLNRYAQLARLWLGQVGPSLDCDWLMQECSAAQYLPLGLSHPLSPPISLSLSGQQYLLHNKYHSGKAVKLAAIEWQQK